MTKCIIFFILIAGSVFGEFSKDVASKVIYFANRGDVTQALNTYLLEAKKEGHNFKILQECGLAILQTGISNEDSNAQILSVLGAGVALHKLSLSILKEALQNKDPKLQIAALNFLGRYDEDEAVDLIKEALSSPFLLIRLEAALLLAEKNESVVIDHLQSCYGRVPEEAKVLFPQILVLLDNVASTKFLRQLLSEPDYKVRIATIIYAAKHKRDDLLEGIRKMANHPGYPVEEASAFALGVFKDSSSKEILENLTHRNNKEVQLAALKALYDLGDKEALNGILQAALEKNLFAIGMLNHFNDENEVISLLLQLISDSDFDVKLNANVALLSHKRKEALPFFQNLISETEKDIGFYTIHSAGKSLKYWKAIPSYSSHTKKNPELKSLTEQFKETILVQALELAEDDFLSLVKIVFEKEQKSSLIPYLAVLLSNHGSEKIISFLKEKLEQAGAPHIRAHAALALYQITNEKIYKDRLLQFIKQEKGKEFVVDISQEQPSERSSPHILNAQEASSFMINALEILTPIGDIDTLETLIEVIAYGNPKNRYALSGLLIRMTE